MSVYSQKEAGWLITIYVYSLKSDFMVELFHHIHKKETHTEKIRFFFTKVVNNYVAFARVKNLNNCLLLRAVKSEVKLYIS